MEENTPLIYRICALQQFTIILSHIEPYSTISDDLATDNSSPRKLSTTNLSVSEIAFQLEFRQSFR
jgi:hypothetical protein